MAIQSSTPATPAAVFAQWSILIAILVILAGIFAIILPIVSGIAITILVGWVLVMVGVLHLFFAFGGRAASSRPLELLLGLVYLIAGGYLILHPVLGLTTLTLMLAIYLLVKGGLEIIQYFQTSPRRGFTWLILDGIINVVLAAIIWSQWPFSSVWVIGTLVGLSILFSGISRLMLSIEMRRTALPAAI